LIQGQQFEPYVAGSAATQQFVFYISDYLGVGLACGIKSLDHLPLPRGTRPRVNPTGARISSIALSLQLAAVTWYELSRAVLVQMGIPPCGFVPADQMPRTWLVPYVSRAFLVQMGIPPCGFVPADQMPRTSCGRIGSTLVNVTIASVGRESRG
jgi:hypothetical protein